MSYPVCTTAANLNNRRVLSLTNPREGGYIADLELLDDVATQSYRGLKISGQRRAAGGISLNGNYTWSRCFGLEMSNTGVTPGSGFTNPANPDFDRGHCSQDRTHLANLTVGAETPRFESTALRVLASGWRASGIVSARSGGWLNIVTGVDTAFNSVSNQRVNQVSDDVYGEKTVDKFLNRAAFANPAPGTLGNYVRNSVRGPGFWKVDLSLSRLFAIATGQQLEARLEAFNLLNNFNWGDPVSNFSNANFGKVQTLASDMRILQFGVKYTF